MCQMKEKEKFYEKLNEIEVIKIPDTEFKTIVIMMLKYLRRMDNISDDLKKR